MDTEIDSRYGGKWFNPPANNSISTPMFAHIWHLCGGKGRRSSNSCMEMFAGLGVIIIGYRIAKNKKIMLFLVIIILFLLYQ